MRLRTDDSIHRFQGRWIDARGTAMPVVARYWAWGVFIMIAPPFGMLLWLIFRDPIPVVILGGGMSALAAGAAADHIGGEYSIGSWVAVARSEITSQRRARAARRANTTPRRAIN